MPRKKKPEPVCDFCRKSRKEVGHLIEGPGASPNSETPVFICQHCLVWGVKLLEQAEAKERAADRQKGGIISTSLPRPADITEYLDEYIIGQSRAKRQMAVAVVNHYKRVFHDFIWSQNNNDHDLANVGIDKSNMLVVGPTGSGKTMLAQTISELMNVPFAIGDATTVTEAGYVGEDVENLLLKLIHAANMDIEAAEQGIIYIDEIDKVARSSGNRSITRDVSGEGVQQALLKMIEGAIANVPPQGGRKHPDQNYIQIDTSNILFICGGTFVGLDEIVAKRLGKRGMGFGAMHKQTESELEDEKSKLLAQVTPEDLVEYGMIPELVGRLPIITSLEEMTVESLVRILTEPKNAITKQYQKLFLMDGVELQFTEESLAAIAKKAKERETGARALRGVVETVMSDLMYDLPDLAEGTTVTVTDDMVFEIAGPVKEAA